MMQPSGDTLGERVDNSESLEGERIRAENLEKQIGTAKEELREGIQPFTWTNDEGVQVKIIAPLEVIQKVIFELTVLAVVKSMREPDFRTSLKGYLSNLGNKIEDREAEAAFVQIPKIKGGAVILASMIVPFLIRKDAQGRPDYFSQKITDNGNADWISEMVTLMQELSKFTKGGWSNSCGWPISSNCTVFKKVWKKESDSLSFKIRYLAGSFMYNRGHVPVIGITADGGFEVIVQKVEKTTTIMGLGPSGCGKTYYAKLLFAKFENATTVVAIDGGITRQMSIAWVVASVLKPKGAFIADIDDVFSGVSKSKKELFGLLEKKKVRTSLYVPDTLKSASTKSPFGLDAYIAEYNYTGGDTVSMLIMQHCVECPYPCPFEEKYKCVGCDESGKNRQETEGKMYSSRNYKSSLNLGYEYFEKATKGVFIHNSGKRATVVDGMPVGHSIIAYKPGTFQNTTPLPNTLFLEMNFPKTYPELEPRLLAITQQTIQTPAGFVNKKKLRAFLEGMKHKGGRTRRKKLYS